MLMNILFSIFILIDTTHRNSANHDVLTKNVIINKASRRILIPTNSRTTSSTNYLLNENDWNDVNGNTCEKYISLEYCNNQGYYGSGWNSNWGIFSDYANDEGVSADNICCGCIPHNSVDLITQNCAIDQYYIDPNDWFDSVGEKCDIYELLFYCAAGDYGPNWDFGVFDTWEDANGISANDVCCECIPTNTPAFITQNCSSHNYANVDYSYEDVWVDSEEFSCNLYIVSSYCEKGDYGPYWDFGWGTFDDYANEDGFSADEVCCECIAEDSIFYILRNCSDYYGTSTYSDVNHQWTDSVNRTCVEYIDNHYCTSGGYGPGWYSNTTITFDEYVNIESGLSANEVCCECIPVDSVAYETQNCSEYDYKNLNNYETWWFAEGSITCGTLIDRRYCVAGNTGPEWRNNIWGTIDSWTDDNELSANEVCCGCIPEDSHQYIIRNCDQFPELYIEYETFWLDSVGDSCQQYVENRWCDNGDYGSSWLDSWGEFREYFNSAGESADNMCCECIPPGTADYRYLNCIEYISAVTWSDSKGDTCQDYIDNQWCDNGLYGLSWSIPELGTFNVWEDSQGHSADEVCCGCIPSYSPSLKLQNCDLVYTTEWFDSEGRSCADYSNMKLCDAGTYGIGWRYEWGLFSAFTNSHGYDASQICCECILPSSQAFIDNYCDNMIIVTTRNDTTINTYENWVDLNGATCQIYAALNWCKDGSYGDGWLDTYGTFDDYANHYYNGHAADKICCECISSTSDEYTSQNCDEYFSKWRDSQYHTCDDYISNEWCVDGSMGSEWKKDEWGMFAKYTNDKDALDATDVCCDCIPKDSVKFQLLCVEAQESYDTNSELTEKLILSGNAIQSQYLLSILVSSIHAVLFFIIFLRCAVNYKQNIKLLTTFTLAGSCLFFVAKALVYYGWYLRTIGFVTIGEAVAEYANFFVFLPGLTMVWGICYIIFTELLLMDKSDKSERTAVANIIGTSFILYLFFYLLWNRYEIEIAEYFTIGLFPIIWIVFILLTAKKVILIRTRARQFSTTSKAFKASTRMIRYMIINLVIGLPLCGLYFFVHLNIYRVYVGVGGEGIAVILNLMYDGACYGVSYAFLYLNYPMIKFKRIWRISRIFPSSKT